MKFDTILALDQATGITGYSLFNKGEIVAYGKFAIEDIKGQDERVEAVKMFLDKMINTFTIDLVVIEDVQQQTNINTFKVLSILQGVLKNYLHENQVPYAIISPSSWRSDLSIKGRERAIQKANAQRYIKNTLDADVTEDEADAICLNLSAQKKLKKGVLEVNHEYLGGIYYE